MAYVRRFSNINRFDPLRLTNSKFLFHDSLLVKIILCCLIVYNLVIVFSIVQFFGRIIRNNRAILLSGRFA